MTPETLQRPATAQVRKDDALRPFRVSFPVAALADLRRRIDATIWPEKETVADGTQGVQLALMQKLARYWATEYDWRKVEAKLNSYPNFLTEIDGLDIHFMSMGSPTATSRGTTSSTTSPSPG